MNAWKLQWNANVPAFEKVTVFLLPPCGSVPVSKPPESAVAVCSALSTLSKVTVPPVFTLIVAGMYMKLLIVTFSALPPPAAGAAEELDEDEEAGAELDDDFELEPLEPHPAIARTASMAASASGLMLVMREVPPRGSPASHDCGR